MNKRVIEIENRQKISQSQLQLQLLTCENLQLKLQLQLQQNRVINYNFVNYNYNFSKPGHDTDDCKLTMCSCALFSSFVVTNTIFEDRYFRSINNQCKTIFFSK